MKIMMMLGLPVPKGFPEHLSCTAFQAVYVSICNTSASDASTLLPHGPPLLFHFFLFLLFFLCPNLFLLSLATRELFGGFAFENLSGAISPLVNKCCDRRQVGVGLEPD